MYYNIILKRDQVILNFQNDENNTEDQDIYAVIFTPAAFALFVERCRAAQAKLPGWW